MSEILSKAKPILFNTDMVRAILDGRKTATRRVLTPQPILLTSPKDSSKHWVWSPKMNTEDTNTDHYDDVWTDFPNGGTLPVVPCTSMGKRIRYKREDILYVRETWQYAFDYDDSDQIIDGTGRFLYAADGNEPFTHWVNEDGSHRDTMPWRPSIHMPKEAARIFLKVTYVGIERLKDIRFQDLLAEGIGIMPEAFNDPYNAYMQAVKAFKSVWDSTVKKSDLMRYGWDANPWVFIIEFERMEVQK